MTAINLDRASALRVALAARALPNIEIGKLIEVLVECLGNPLSLEALARITVTDLKTGLGSVDGEEDGEDIAIGLDAMKLAVRILWGETEEDENLPVPQPFAGDMPGSIRVAVSSNSGARLDGHFGSCLRYLVYQVSADQVRLVDVRSSVEADLSEDRNAFRAALIRDCQVVYVVSVGGPAAAKIIHAGIYPIKKIDGGEAQEVLAELQRVMRASPPPWLAKILGVEEGRRLKNYRGGEEAEAGLSTSALVWLNDLGFDAGNLNSRIDNGMSALMVAARHARARLVDELLEAGADVNLLNDDENPALWFACVGGDPGIVRRLIAAGADLDNQNVNGATCLVYAASSGKQEMVELLVEAGADLSRQTLDGFTALDSAATLPVLKYLKPRYAAKAVSA